MQEIEGRVENLEKLSGVSRERSGRSQHAGAGLSQAAFSKGAGARRERQGRTGTDAETKSVSRKSNNSDSSQHSSASRSKGSKKGRAGARDSASSGASESNSDVGLGGDVSGIAFEKMAADIRELKAQVKRMGSKLFIKGAAGPKREPMDLFSQMSLRSEEMKKTFADQREQFDLIKDEMKQELKRLQRQDFSTSTRLEDL